MTSAPVENPSIGVVEIKVDYQQKQKKTQTRIPLF
jgi:hypothetical protein